MVAEEGTGSLSTALHLQAGPTSWTPDLGLMPRKEAGRCRTDAEFKLQIDNNTLRLLLADLAREEQLGETRQLRLSAVPCGTAIQPVWAYPQAELLSALASPQDCRPQLSRCAQPSRCSLITREKKRTQLLQPGHLKKHWESLTSGVSVPQSAIKESECFVFLK